MPILTRRDLLALMLAAPVSAYAFGDESGDWISLFDGKSLDEWTLNEHAGSFRVVHGQIATLGGPSHLFYTGPVRNADFKNFELSADVMTRPGAISGIYFHTAYQRSGLPAAGFKVQVENSGVSFYGDIERRKTGSLYSVRNVYKQLVNDNEWFQINILVRGKQVQVRVNNMLVVDYVEPEQPFQPDANFQRALNHGTFALQAYAPGSYVYFKNIRVRPLADDIAPISNERPEVDELYRDIIRLSAGNYPLVDYHVHLKGGLTIEQALANSIAAWAFPCTATTACASTWRA